MFSPNSRIVQGTNSRISPLTTSKLIVGPSNPTGWFTTESYSGEKAENHLIWFLTATRNVMLIEKLLFFLNLFLCGINVCLKFCVSTKIFSDFHFCMVPGFWDLLLGSKIKNLFLTKNRLQPLSLKTKERQDMNTEILSILEVLVEIFQ